MVVECLLSLLDHEAFAHELVSLNRLDTQSVAIMIMTSLTLSPLSSLPLLHPTTPLVQVGKPVPPLFLLYLLGLPPEPLQNIPIVIVLFQRVLHMVHQQVPLAAEDVLVPAAFGGVGRGLEDTAVGEGGGVDVHYQRGRVE